jgi:uncharacterized membrane protein
MGKNRLEAFSDGVNAIIITVWCWNLKSRMARTCGPVAVVARFHELRAQLRVRRD